MAQDKLGRLDRHTMVKELEKLDSTGFYPTDVLHHPTGIHAVRLGNNLLRIYSAGPNRDVRINISDRKLAKIKFMLKCINQERSLPTLVEGLVVMEKIYWSLKMLDHDIRLLHKIKQNYEALDLTHRVESNGWIADDIFELFFLYDTKYDRFFMVGCDNGFGFKTQQQILNLAVARYLDNRDDTIADEKQRLERNRYKRQNGVLDHDSNKRLFTVADYDTHYRDHQIMSATSMQAEPHLAAPDYIDDRVAPPTPWYPHLYYPWMQYSGINGQR